MKYILLFFLLTLSLSSLADERRTYFDAFESTGDTSVVIHRDSNVIYEAVEMRVALPQLKERDGLAKHFITLKIGHPDKFVTIKINPGTKDYGHLSEHQYVSIAANFHGDNIIATSIIDQDIAFGRGENSYSVEIDSCRTIRVYAGKRHLNQAIFFTLPEILEGGGIYIQSTGCVRVADLVYAREKFSSSPTSIWNLEQLQDHFKASNIAIEGFWQYLDRDNDERYARPGGKYTLAIVKSTYADGFDILYIDGAKVNQPNWHPCMIKGRLKPTIFKNHYNLEWYDSSMKLMNDEQSASIEQSSILTLSFPLYKTSLRFSKIPQDM